MHHQLEAASRKLRHGCIHQGVQLRPGSCSIAGLVSGIISSLLKRWLDGDGSGGSAGSSVSLDVASVNDAPYFLFLGDQTVAEDGKSSPSDPAASTLVTVTGFVTFSS